MKFAPNSLIWRWLEAAMLDTRQIHPLTDFLRNHKAHIARLKKPAA